MTRLERSLCPRHLLELLHPTGGRHRHLEEGGWTARTPAQSSGPFWQPAQEAGRIRTPRRVWEVRSCYARSNILELRKHGGDVQGVLSDSLSQSGLSGNQDVHASRVDIAVQ
jgi:hypothetical protein